LGQTAPALDHREGPKGAVTTGPDNRRAQTEAEAAQQRSQVIHGSPGVGVPHFAVIAVPGDLVNTCPWQGHQRALDRARGEVVSSAAPATPVPGRGRAVGSAPNQVTVVTPGRISCPGPFSQTGRGMPPGEDTVHRPGG